MNIIIVLVQLWVAGEGPTIVAVAAVLLLVYVYLRVLVCSVIQKVWCSVTHVGGMPPTGAGANIAVLVLKTELTAGSSYTWQLAVPGSWVGRWDDGLGAVLLLRCCELFVVAVVVVAVVLCLLARVGVLGHRRGTALGHPCGMLPTGANIVCYY